MFLDAAGLAPSKEMTGRSFLKLLRGQPYSDRAHVFAQRSAHGRGLPRSSARSRRYFSPQRPIFEIYDLENDPSEFNNLAGRKEAASIERTLKMTLSEWMIRERDYLPIPFPGGEGDEG